MKYYFIPLLILSGVGYYAYTQIKKAKNVKIGFRFLAPKLNLLPQYGFEKLPVEIGLFLQNITDFTVKIETIKIDVYFNEKLVTTLFKTANFEIKANQKNDFTMTALIELKNLGFTLNEIINFFSKNTKANIYLRGFVNTNLGRANINEKLNF
jgi:hypothetical protein